MSGTLYTNFGERSGTVAYFDGFDRIQASATNDWSPVRLRLTDGGTLDLRDEMPGTPLTIVLSDQSTQLMLGYSSRQIWNRVTGGAGDDTVIGNLRSD